MKPLFFIGDIVYIEDGGRGARGANDYIAKIISTKKHVTGWGDNALVKVKLLKYKNGTPGWYSKSFRLWGLTPECKLRLIERKGKISLKDVTHIF